MKVASFVGRSGAGKTTAIASLILRYRDLGFRVGAMKHTHHEINDRNEGDTATMREAGADPVIFAGEEEAVIFGRTTHRVSFTDPRDLLTYFDACDIVLIEGFRNVATWPRVELASDQRRTTTELVAILDRIWRS